MSGAAPTGTGTTGRVTPDTTPAGPTGRGVHPAVLLPALGALTVLVAVAGLAIGARALPPAEVFASLTGSGSHEVDVVVLDQRLPRTVIGLVVGAALAMSGSLMQALTRNPLADPGILGVNAGAAVAVVAAASLTGGTGLEQYRWAALAGAGAAALAVSALGGIGGGAASTVRLALAGVAVSAALGALTQVVVLADQDVFEEFRLWVNGSLQNRWFEHMWPVTPLFALGVLLAVLVVPGLDALALGTGVGRALGVPVRRVRAGTLAAVALLAGSATAVAGPLAFVGLAAPFVARRLAGSDLRGALPASALVGAALVVGADVVARVAVTSEAPVGAVVTVAGAPLFVALVRARRVPRL